MKSFLKHVRYCIIAVFAVFTVSAYGQLMTGVDPGLPTKISNSDRVETHQQIPADNLNNQTLPQSDEYGQYNFNAYLTGLGATGGYMAVNNPPNENVDGSVEAWIYPTATTSSAPCIVGKGDATNVGFLFGWVASSTKLYLRFGSTPVTNTAGTNVPLNTWTHVAATWTGGAGNYTVQFYVNGAPSGGTVSNTGSWNVASDSLTVGTIKAPFGGKNFYGYIDEVLD